jgi:hypothetical protein
MGLRFVGVEAEPAYLQIAAARLREAERDAGARTLFSPATTVQGGLFGAKA